MYGLIGFQNQLLHNGVTKMKGFIIKIINTTTSDNKFVPEGTTQEHYLVKGGYVRPTYTPFLSPDDLYKNKGTAKRALNRYISDKTKNSYYESSYEIVEIG